MTTGSTRFWHPFSDMSNVAGNEVILDRGEGAWVWDRAGRRYYDATASLWYCNVGHGRAELADAAARQMRRLDSYSTFGSYANEPVIELAERVCSLAPIPEAVAFFTTGGSDAVDTAAKLVRRYWDAVGHPERQLFVVRDGAYHGMNTYGTSLAGIPANAAGYGELVPGVVRVARDDTADLERILQEHSGRVAAFFAEPMIGAGGVYPPVDGYWARVQELCGAHDVLLVVDEVVTGFGRLAHWFASERYGIQADVILGAKGITSGYFPVGVVICGPRIQEPFWRGSAGLLRHGYTYSGHATGAAVALANLDVIEAEGLLVRVRSLEGTLASALSALSGHPLVAEVRTAGLTGAVELTSDALIDDPGIIDRVVRAAHERGVLTRGLVGKALHISPPLITTPAELYDLAEVLSDSIDAVARQRLATAVDRR
ncbi:MAG: aminotransferase class III-fold pyridoxal phosphate-dependent enzyme [Candidatus Dormiibacterota bacterium]